MAALRTIQDKAEIDRQAAQMESAVMIYDSVIRTQPGVGCGADGKEPVLRCPPDQYAAAPAGTVIQPAAGLLLPKPDLQ